MILIEIIFFMEIDDDFTRINKIKSTQNLFLEESRKKKEKRKSFVLRTSLNLILNIVIYGIKAGILMEFIF